MDNVPRSRIPAFGVRPDWGYVTINEHPHERDILKRGKAKRVALDFTDGPCVIRAWEHIYVFWPLDTMPADALTRWKNENGGMIDISQIEDTHPIID